MVPVCDIYIFLRKCYQAFDSEDSLFHHVTSSHEGISYSFFGQDSNPLALGAFNFKV